MAHPHSPGVSGGGIERLRLVADSLPVMIRHSTPDRLATYFNKPWLDFTGRTLEQESGSGWSENVHPEDLERCLTTAERAFDAQERFEMQYRLRRSDGQYRWVVDRGAPLHAQDGTFLGYVGGCIDVTDAKQAAADLDDRAEQTFFAIGLVARAALMEVPLERSTEPLAGALARVVDLASAGARHVRQRSIVPAVVAEGPAQTIVALRLLARTFQRRTGIDTALIVSGLPRQLPAEVVETLESVSEAVLSSLERRTLPGAVLFGLRFGTRTVTLNIQHDARIQMGGVAEDIGLAGVSQRVHQLGGSMMLRSSRDGGGLVRVRLHVRRARYRPVDVQAAPVAVGRRPGR
jgi:PAS domain S-box-containing protein